MDTHPWTAYEIARLRDAERLVRARAAMQAMEVRDERRSEAQTSSAPRIMSWLDRIRRRGSVAKRTPAGVG